MKGNGVFIGVMGGIILGANCFCYLEVVTMGHGMENFQKTLVVTMVVSSKRTI